MREIDVDGGAGIGGGGVLLDRNKQGLLRGHRGGSDFTLRNFKIGKMTGPIQFLLAFLCNNIKWCQRNDLFQGKYLNKGKKYKSSIFT
jgi:hypothetical protein